MSSPPPAPDSTQPAPDSPPPAESAAPGSPPQEPLAPLKLAPPPMPSAVEALGIAAAVSVLVTLMSRLAPKKYGATGVGIAFLTATWALTIRRDDIDARVWGLSLGGLLDREKIDWGRLLRDAATALLWAGLLAVVFFPPFYFGYVFFWHPAKAFVLRAPESMIDELAGQAFVIALPEEAFFRGYLQTALDAAWPPKWRVLGAMLGPGWLLSAAVFAVGHVLTAPSPARLAVFFPALVFGWLRARTGGIGAGVVFHAACNIYSATLARGFGLPV